MDSKVGDILKDADQIVTTLQKYYPAIGVVKGMSLKDLLALPQAKQFGITGPIVQQVIKDNKMNYTLDSKVGDILKDSDQLVTILQNYVPMVGMVKGMSLKDLLALPQANQFGITPAMVQQVLNEVNAK
jgi:hypothetical protein